MQKFSFVAAIALFAAAGAHAQAAPVVQSPESVYDWTKAGERFVRDSERAEYIGRGHHHKGKNVILFVGDGMGISTVTAARILEDQMNGKPGEENRLSFEN